MRYFTHSFNDLTQGTPFYVNVDKWKQICLQLSSEIVNGQEATLDNCDGGLYVGCAGIGYMLYKLLNNPILKVKEEEYKSIAVDYVTVSLKFCSKRTRDPGPSFLLGPAGVYFTAALVANHIGDIQNRDSFIAHYSKYSTDCLKLNFLRDGSDELFVGRAGYLCGLYNLRKILGIPVVDDSVVKSLCDVILQSGREYSKRRRLQVPLMYSYYRTEYLGAAHGLSSILQMLLRFSQYLDEDGLKDVKNSVDYFLTIEQSNYNYVPATDELGRSRRPDSEELVHWCHGAPGVVYMFAQAYKVWNDDKYLQVCIRCAELTWIKGLLKKGPGICHGIAGSAYVFLLLYRLTNDVKYLYRAEKFADFMFTDEFRCGARNPDSPFSLYEGWAGTVCFLSDLTQPDKAEFPFFDVF